MASIADWFLDFWFLTNQRVRGIEGWHCQIYIKGLSLWWLVEQGELAKYCINFSNASIFWEITLKIFMAFCCGSMDTYNLKRFCLENWILNWIIVTSPIFLENLEVYYLEKKKESFLKTYLVVLFIFNGKISLNMFWLRLWAYFEVYIKKCTP